MYNIWDLSYFVLNLAVYLVIPPVSTHTSTLVSPFFCLFLTHPCLYSCNPGTLNIPSTCTDTHSRISLYPAPHPHKVFTHHILLSFQRPAKLSWLVLQDAIPYPLSPHETFVPINFHRVFLWCQSLAFIYFIVVTFQPFRDNFWMKWFNCLSISSLDIFFTTYSF